jgi:diadenosine tetraphosphatase ApaH/serine/threonine PP2A family protein phosphatase
VSAVAVISDVHANLEALDAVLADIARRGIVSIYCLGDLLCYGPNPVECLGRAATWDVVLRGDWDERVLSAPTTELMPEHLRIVEWTRTALSAAGSPEDVARRREYLTTRRLTHALGDFLFAHGTPRDPLNEWLFPEDVYNPATMAEIGTALNRYGFVGNTHLPGAFVQSGDDPGAWEYFAPAEVHDFWRFDGRKAIINVGSVGQPRDGDPRACYVTVDGWDVNWHRVPYDVDATVAKVYAVPDLDNIHGDRLREGR